MFTVNSLRSRDISNIVSSLSNNLIDFDTPIHVVKGFQGVNLEELQTNLKKKIIGVDDDGGVDVKTVDVPYQVRQAKLELDEKNIYRFGMGLNTAGLKDTNATTNIAIKAAYSLLDLKCSKLEIRLKQLLRRLLKLIIVEINETDGTDYHCNQVYFEFSHEVMSNERENAQIALTEAQKTQVLINTLLSLASQLDNETLMRNICDALDIDYDEIKGKLPNPDEAENEPAEAQKALDGVNADESETKGNILTSCGQQQKETGEQEVSKTAEITETDFTDKGQSELSELEKQIEEFEKGTSDETTITQDILRGEWRITSKDNLVNGGFKPETVKLGNLEVDYDTSSKDSKIIFTDDEFMIFYDEPILSKGYPMTCGWLSQSDDEQLYTGYSRTKTKNTLNLNKKEKKRVWLYDVTPQEE